MGERTHKKAIQKECERWTPRERLDHKRRTWASKKAATAKAVDEMVAERKQARAKRSPMQQLFVLQDRHDSVEVNSDYERTLGVCARERVALHLDIALNEKNSLADRRKSKTKAEEVFFHYKSRLRPSFIERVDRAFAKLMEVGL